MKRWLALFLLLASNSGCMLFEDDRYDGYDRPPHAWDTPPSANSCAMPTNGVVNVSQTIEPPR
jgi:hypothetical protein